MRTPYITPDVNVRADQDQAGEQDLRKALEQVQILRRDADDAGTSLYALKAVIEFIETLSVKGGIDDSEQIANAMFWLTQQGASELAKIKALHSRIYDIANAATRPRGR